MARLKKIVAKKKSVAVKTAVKKVKKIAAKKSIVKPKKKKVTAIPKGYNSVTPYLILNNATKAIEFYKKVFDAKERMRMEYSGKVGHCELKIGDSIIMLADECPEKGVMSPKGASSVCIHLYVKDVDAVFKKAVSSGAKALRAVDNMFYGDRIGCVEDPFGHQWSIATHIEDVSPAKMKKRAQEAFGKASK